MNVKYDLVVDFARPSKSNTIMISENDKDSRTLHFTLLNNKQPMGMSDVTNAVIQAVKRDGKVVGSVATILTDSNGQKINELEYTIPKTMVDTAGVTTMVIILQSDSGQELSSFETYLQVRNALYNEDDYASEDDFSGFRELLQETQAEVEELRQLASSTALPNPNPINIEVEGTNYQYTGATTVNVALNDMAYIADDITDVVEALDNTSANVAAYYAGLAEDSADEAETYLNDTSANATKSEGYAAGTNNGTAVAEGSPYYHNNAKYYYLEAKDAAGRCEAYSTHSLESEGWAKGTQNGIAVEEGSPYYHNNAEYFASIDSVEDRLDSAATDKALSANQGRVLNDTKQDKLIAGDNIYIDPDTNTISATGGGGGGGGTTNYNMLTNKPSINNVTLSGNKSLSDLGIDIPDVPSWALESNKPTYTAAEVGALPSTTSVPSALSQLSDDATHRVVTDTEKADWNANSTVAWSQVNTEGRKIAEITIDGTMTEVFAPTSEGGGGTTNYQDLSNKPSINNVTLTGNKTLSQLGIPTSYSGLNDKPSINDVVLSGNKTLAELGIDIPDVPDWALADTKPVYTAAEVGALENSTTHLSGDVPITRKVNNKALSSDITLTASDVNALASTTTHLSGDVPTTRKINSKALSSDITLTASDVGALASTVTHLSGDVPTSRKINNKALSSDITLTASDVGALPSTTTIPTQLSQLTDDSTHRLVTDSQISAWDAGGGGGMLPKLHIVSDVGSTVTVSKGSKTITPTGSNGIWECDVDEYGTWTITSTLNGDTTTASVYVNAVKVYNIDDSHFHATITVTYTTGATCYIEKEDERYYASSSPFAFAVHSAGTWRVVCYKDADSTSKTVNITTEGQSESVSVSVGYSIEDWLGKAGITTSYVSFDAISEIDMRKAMTIHESSDYLVSWINEDNSIIDDIVACEYAMKWIGLRDYICDKLMAISACETAMLASDNWEYILKDKVPTMTSNTAPYGEASASSCTGNGYAWKAFNGTNSGEYDGWTATNNNSIQYKFVNPVCVRKVYAENRAYQDTNCRVKNFIVYASNDGSTWDDLSGVITRDYSTNISGGNSSHNIDNNNYYLYYKVTCTSTFDSSSYVGFGKLQFYGRSLNVSVPTMTSNTAPWGEANNYRPFSKQEQNASCYFGSDGIGLYYKFPKKVVLGGFMLGNRNYAGGTNAVKTFKVQGSNNGTVWTDITQVLENVIGNTNNSVGYYQTQKSEYQYFRIQTISGYAGDLCFGNVDFFGVDYSEREFESGSTMKYIYDHGLELEGIESQGNSCVKNTDHLRVQGTSQGINGFITMNPINTTNYNLERAIVGNELVNYDDGFGYIESGSAKPMTTSNRQGYGTIKGNDAPSNAYYDTSNINNSNYLLVGTWHTQQILTITEWWLE